MPADLPVFPRGTPLLLVTAKLKENKRKQLKTTKTNTFWRLVFPSTTPLLLVTITFGGEVLLLRTLG